MSVVRDKDLQSNGNRAGGQGQVPMWTHLRRDTGGQCRNLVEWGEACGATVLCYLPADSSGPRDATVPDEESGLVSGVHLVTFGAFICSHFG